MTISELEVRLDQLQARIRELESLQSRNPVRHSTAGPPRARNFQVKLLAKLGFDGTNHVAHVQAERVSSGTELTVHDFWLEFNQYIDENMVVEVSWDDDVARYWVSDCHCSQIVTVDLEP